MVADSSLPCPFHWIIFDKMQNWLVLGYLVLLCFFWSVPAFNVHILRTNPATTSAFLDSYNFGLTKKDCSAYWFSNWFLDDQGALRSAFVACKYNFLQVPTAPFPQSVLGTIKRAPNSGIFLMSFSYQA